MYNLEYATKKMLRNSTFLENYNPKDINEQDGNGNTLLHLIAEKKPILTQAGIANILRQNPDPFIKNNHGMTPRLLAELLGHTSHAAALAAYESSYKEDLDEKRYRLIGNLLDMLPAVATSKFVVNPDCQKRFIELAQQLQQINQRN